LFAQKQKAPNFFSVVAYFGLSIFPVFCVCQIFFDKKYRARFPLFGNGARPRIPQYTLHNTLCYFNKKRFMFDYFFKPPIMIAGKQMKIIDTHAHIYPQKVGEKARKNISAFYGLPLFGVGASSKDLLKSGSTIGVCKYVVHSTATAKSQVKSINDFIISETALHSEFAGFATLHPDMTEEEVFCEAARVKASGLMGVKLHPDFQKFLIDDEKAFKIYDACSRQNLPILFHTGDMRFDYSSPYRLIAVAKAFPRLLAIAAHLGGYTRWDEAMEYKGLDNIFFDTSSSLFRLAPSRAKELINHLGHGRFFFGVDFPMWTHEGELARFLSLGFSDEINECILSKNAERVLNL
jgi:predicted TIM-barrel fold metal-dependent hydrolase